MNATHAQIEMRLDAVDDAALAERSALIYMFQWRFVNHLRFAGTCYIDDIDLSYIPLNHRGCVGVAIRLLIKQRKIEQTGNHKRSSRPESAGRQIWEYRLT